MEQTVAAPADSGGNSAAPLTFEQAFAADASPASDPSQQSNDATAAAQPTTEAEASPQQPDERSPFIPRARFDEVVTARQQAEEALQAWKDYEWVRQIPANDFKSVVDRLVRTKGDPIAVITELIGEAAADPQWGPKLRQLALQQSQPSAPKPGLPDLSQVVVDLGNGQTLSLADFKASVLSEVEQKFGQPLQTVEQIAAERQQLQAQQAADKFAQATIGKLAALPGFDQHKAQIGDYVAQHPPRDDQGRFTDDPHALRAAAYEAYLQIVVPTLSSSAQSQLLDDLKHKARASTSVNPGSAAPSTPKAYGSFAELPADAWT